MKAAKTQLSNDQIPNTQFLSYSRHWLVIGYLGIAYLRNMEFKIMALLKSIVKVVLYQPLFNALIFLIWLFPGDNVAPAIIALTIIIRLILLPSSIKATQQQKRMRDLQPRIQEIQEKYKADKQKQAQELMNFYKENKINPAGSCLPLLIQLPILLVLYYVFLNGLNDSHFNLLYSFTPRPEHINTNFFGIDLAKPERFILPVIAGVLQFIQGRQIMPPVKAKEGQEMQAMISKQMLYLMPVFTIFIAGRLPAALPLYWIVTTLFGIAQQWWVLKKKDNNEVPGTKKEEDNNKTIKKKGVEVTVRRKSAK